MPIVYEKLMQHRIPPVEQVLTKKDTILYALGTGLGHDPMDEQQLRFVYEKDLQALPTMAIILGYPGPWHAHGDTGIDRTKVVHGEQGFEIHRPLPVEGTLTGETRIVNVLDKGEGKGALLISETKVRMKDSGELVCTLSSTTFARANGGFGGPSGPQRPVQPIPERTPDRTCDIGTRPEQALIYRLSGDYNPLHAEPAYAARAGYRMPILHGRCTFGVVGHALLDTCCGYDPVRLRSMYARFSSPVYPGDTIRTEMWLDGNVVTFRATVPARDNIVVLNNGRAEIA
jgi:acyl dehydratase